MIYLRLFLTFLKIGAVAFGGGYAMIPLMRDECLANGWLSDSELLDFIAISESTPGPVAVNMATFVGSSQAGILGALLATVGVVLPAFIVTLLIVTVLGKLLEYRGTRAVLSGVRPAVVALILSTAALMFLSLLFGIKRIGDAFSISLPALFLFFFLVLVAFLFRRIRHKSISPIFLIVLSGVAGVILFR
ncbi:MAG: chromate transporter [Clostridia bacterium]|nr:chromate transporter [Clostridia bacterium]